MKRNSEPKKKLELYVHIPFCARKCLYCDFVSFAGREAEHAPYIDALCREIRACAPLLSDYTVSSVFIGGGTPTVLEADLLVQLIETLVRSFAITGLKEKRRGFRAQKRIDPETEFTVECNPGSADRNKLKALKKAGVNRISFGLQSADERELSELGRIHTFADFLDSYEAAREAGFSNLNVDLMQAVPHQNLAGWRKTLSAVTSLGPEHISAYSLIVEEGTPFAKRQKEGSLALPDEETEREIYYATREFLEAAGYFRYEISNYARPGLECRHNIGYWQRTPYLGLGLNAASLLEEVRWRNTADLEAYRAAFSEEGAAKDLAGTLMKQVQKRTEHPMEPAILDLHPLSHREQMEEFLFLGLRMTEGISKQRFFDTFGQDFDFTYGAVVQDLKAKGLLQTEEDRVFLTDRGVDVSNQVFAEFLLE